MGRSVANERGGTLVLVAVSTAAMLAIGAISVDLSILVRMRNEAQRAADAAALAGASAYLDAEPLLARPTARDRALDFASRNTIGGVTIDTSGQVMSGLGNDWTVTTKEASVEVAPMLTRVRVAIRRAGVGTFFARFLGKDVIPISAVATAEAVPAGRSRCVMPFAVPDSGYGTGDFGRPIVLTPDSAGSFTPWQFAEGGTTGPNSVDARMSTCDPREVILGSDSQAVASSTGREHFADSMQARINRDPAAYWDGNVKRIIRPDPSDWRNSARVVQVALYDPTQAANSLQPIEFNNIALMFLDNVDPTTRAVTVRLLYYAAGVPGSGTPGQFVKVIRLVE